MKYFINSFSPFRESAHGASKKIADLPAGTIVEYWHEEFNEALTPIPWAMISYNGRRGYVPSSMVEPYLETLQKNCVEIPDQTEDPNDFEQYFYLKNIKQVNFCGPLAICYATGLTLKEFMGTWEIQKPALWKRIKGLGRFSGTTDSDLVEMCAAFALEPLKMGVVTKDTFVNRSRYTVGGMQKLARMGFPIVACKIDGSTGRLRGQGVGHWVVITQVFPERTGGRVHLYNPAPNRIEEYSWNELISSMNQPYGIWIEKEKNNV
jgi:hypothetical protein